MVAGCGVNETGSGDGGDGHGCHEMRSARVEEARSTE